jgi:hypothetical protein
MREHTRLTEALWAILHAYLRGYRHSVTVTVSADRIPALDLKWAEAYGTRLPAWQRHSRRRRHLPCALAHALPVPSYPGSRHVVLMLDGYEHVAGLDPASPWRRERWRPGVEVGDYRISQDRRDRGDMTTTWRLTPACYSGLDRHWRSLAQQGRWGDLEWEMRRAVGFYPLFGGIRRQLRRLIRGYAKLAARHGRQLGIDPERLPTIALPGHRRPLQTDGDASTSTP